MIFFLNFFFPPQSPFSTLLIFYQLLIFYTPHFPQSVFSVHSLITWLSHDNDELCSQSINCLVGNIFRQNVLKRSVRWVLPWIYPLACPCWWFLDCLYPPQRFQVMVIAFKYLTNITLPLEKFDTVCWTNSCVWKNYFTFRTTRTKTTQNLIRRIIMPNFDFSKSNTLLILSVSSNFALSYRLKE